MSMMITAEELKNKLKSNEDIQIIDVREDYEYEDFNLGGINIPLDNVLTSVDQIDETKPVVFCCKSGKRSAAIALALSKKFQRSNLYSLKGGVEAYMNELSL